MGDRSSCWSITINNPTDEDTPKLPAGWVFEGQLEQGEAGTRHVQGMLTTGATVRFSAVKKVFPRAHIEVARNKAALAKYIKKEETRIAALPVQRSEIPTLFDYQTIISSHWIEDDFQQLCKKYMERAERSLTFKFPDVGDIALEYIDSLVAEDIKSGRKGAEYIAINPMWRSSWKKFYRSIITRDARQESSTPVSPQEERSDAPQETDESIRQCP